MARTVKEWVGATEDTRAPPRVLRRIFEREGGRCHLSGRVIAPGELWQADHKIALINGGMNCESNLFPALGDPHKEKTRADVAEKKRVAALALSNIGGSRSAPSFHSRGFAKQPREPKRLTKTCAGETAFARRIVTTGEAK